MKIIISKMWISVALVVLPGLCSAVMWLPKTQIAPYSDVGVPSNSNRRRPALSSYSSPDDIELVLSPKWPDPSVKFGQLAAVTVDKYGQVVVFHRGSHIWDGSTFNIHDNYMKKDEGPVHVDTVLALDPNSGVILKSWGKDFFYLPHGLTIDDEDYLWVTDVALHQVFKFPPLANLNDSTKPLLTLGERFVNGKDELHFCKPSGVAVMKNGDFFVADGYCNSRIIKYDKEGNRLMTWGRSSFSGDYGHKPGPYQFYVPHALTIAEDRNLLCVADRENGRVQCFNAHNGTFVYEISSEQIGSRLFSVAYTPTHGGLFYIVNGPVPEQIPVKGFIVDANNLKIVSTFQAGKSPLSNPHDIAVSPDGESVYVVQLDPFRALKFVHKGDESLSDPANTPSDANQSLQSSNPPSSLASSSKPTVTSIDSANSTSALPVGLSLMANSSFAKAMSTPLAAVAALMVILVCVTGSGIVWFMRTRRRAYPAIPNDGFNLGHLLASHSRRGFEQVSTEESDDDRAESDQPA